MEKAHGRIERAIVDHLHKGKGLEAIPTPAELARAIFATAAPTTAQLVSVRRALRSLERKRLVERRRKGSGRRAGYWQLHKRARKPRERGREEQEQKEDLGRERERLHQWQSRLSDLLGTSRSPKPKDIATLAAILGMLGSAHDGEALSAARRAEEWRRQHGLTWRQILR